MKGTLACSYFDQLIDIGGDERLGSVTPLAISTFSQTAGRMSEFQNHSAEHLHNRYLSERDGNGPGVTLLTIVLCLSLEHSLT